MKKSALLFSLCVAVSGSVLADDPQPTITPEALQTARAACETDIQKFCAGVQPGGGRIIACMKQHNDEVSDGCKKAIAKARKSS